MKSEKQISHCVRNDRWLFTNNSLNCHFEQRKKSALEKTYFVYLLASKSRRLYVGVTNNLERRLYEHKQKLVDGFTKSYNIDRLVFFESTNDVRSALEREKEIKRWRREKKIALIETMNPAWDDLSESWKSEEADFSPMKPGSK